MWKAPNKANTNKFCLSWSQVRMLDRKRERGAEGKGEKGGGEGESGLLGK